MSKLNLIFSLLLMTFLWGGVGYAAGLDSNSSVEPSGGDLFTFFIAIVVTVGFGLRVWQALTRKDQT